MSPPDPRSTGPAANETLKLQLHAEEMSVKKRRFVDQVVRAATKTFTRDVLIQEPLTTEGIIVEHVPVGRYVDAVPPVRYEGDATILSVVEEEVVVTKRLFLREEVHLRRVQTTTNHNETVTLREQKIVVTREAVEPPELDRAFGAEGELAFQQPTRSMPMQSETIVAVYDTAAHANAAIADLRSSKVPENAISRHSQAAPISSTAPAPREEGFWGWLFGGNTDRDAEVYDRSLEAGSSVVVVKSAPGYDVDAVIAILERHSPIDLDERASSYGMTPEVSLGAAPAGAVGATESTISETLTNGYTNTEALPSGVATRAGETETVPLAEESLAVGKRLINRGSTRIRRYVVETPVEENVSLQSEKVTLERHPVTDNRPVADGSFSEKVIEMTETAEEAVVSKTARVVEEVEMHKEATDRVETVHDTLRKEKVDIEQIPAGTTDTSTARPAPLTNSKI